MQYVSFVPGIHVFTVDVRLTPLDSSSTSVEVTYARTALNVEQTTKCKPWEMGTARAVLIGSKQLRTVSRRNAS